MALIKCPGCGMNVSSFLNTCPYCGFRIIEHHEEKVSRNVVSLRFKSIADLSDYSCMDMPKAGIISEIILTAVIDPFAIRKIHFYLHDVSGIYLGPECDLNRSFDALFGAIFSNYKYFEKLILSNTTFQPFPQHSCYSEYLRQLMGNDFTEAIHLIKQIAFQQIGLNLEFEQKEYPDKNREYTEELAKKAGRKNNRAYPNNSEWQMNFAPASSLCDMNIALWNSKTKYPCVATEADIIVFSNRINQCLTHVFGNSL